MNAENVPSRSDAENNSVTGGGRSNRPLLMEQMTVKEVTEALQRTQTVILPVGCVEQHGWHLPLNTDIFNAYEVAKEVSCRTGCLVAPVMPYSYSGGELPGTINISPQTAAAVIIDICNSLARQGFRHIIVLLGHGGSENLQGVRAGLDIALRSGIIPERATVALVPFYELSPTIMACLKEKDYHAGKFETSLMLYWHPEMVRDERPTDTPEIRAMLRGGQDAYQKALKKVAHPLVMARIRQDERIKIGVFGDPDQADAALGKQMCDEVCCGLVELIRQMEAAPDPA
ncbi:MAG TPA: creatininase family protein [Firmicutes bacterium]|nr:creatininase family protein [Bacillota bacterium]